MKTNLLLSLSFAFVTSITLGSNSNTEASFKQHMYPELNRTIKDLFADLDYTRRENFRVRQLRKEAIASALNSTEKNNECSNFNDCAAVAQQYVAIYLKEIIAHRAEGVYLKQALSARKCLTCNDNVKQQAAAFKEAVAVDVQRAIDTHEKGALAQYVGHKLDELVRKKIEQDMLGKSQAT